MSIQSVQVVFKWTTPSVLLEQSTLTLTMLFPAFKIHFPNIDSFDGFLNEKISWLKFGINNFLQILK